MTSPVEGDKKQKVLVIDDDRDVCLLLKQLLAKEGYQVSIAFSGKEGLALFDRESFDVVVLDIALGDMDGAKVAEMMRSKKRAPFKIIGITAYSRSIVEERDPKGTAFFTAIYSKPFSHKELIEILRGP